MLFGYIDICKLRMELTFHREKHVEYIKALDEKKDSFHYLLMEHLKMSGTYWGLTALALLNRLDVMKKEEVISFVISCQHPNGGFSGNVGHDPHLLYTLSAVQILAMYESLNSVNTEAIVSYVKSLQQEDGSFFGDNWGEVDTRFSYCALSCLSLLGRLNEVNVPKAIEFIIKCQNFDGGFGSLPGAESHAGQIFCCVGALAIVDSLHLIDQDLLAWWLCERQVKNGGLNGRPEKLEDVCYSWWCLSCLCILERIDWLSKDKLIEFILTCQDSETGGISDRPGDMVDVFHTLFGITGLSMLGYPGLNQVDPVYCMPHEIIEKMGLSKYKPASL